MTGSSFASIYRESLEHSDEFWDRAAREIDWATAWDTVLDDEPWDAPATVDGPATFDEITSALASIGYPR